MKKVTFFLLLFVAPLLMFAFTLKDVQNIFNHTDRMNRDPWRLTEELRQKPYDGGWRNDEKLLYHYVDGYHTQSDSTMFYAWDADSENWAVSIKAINEFEGRRIVRTKLYMLDDGEWSLFFDIPIQHNEDNLAEHVSVLMAAGDGFIELYELSVDYSESYVVKLTIACYQGDSTYYEQRVYSAFRQGALGQEVIYLSEDGEEWEPFRMNLFSYIPEDTSTWQDFIRLFNAELPWLVLNDLKLPYGGLLDEISSHMMEGNGEWHLFQHTIHTYNEQLQLIQKETEYPYYDGWHPSSRIFYEYDDNGNQTTMHEQDWDWEFGTEQFLDKRLTHYSWEAHLDVSDDVITPAGSLAFSAYPSPFAEGLNIKNDSDGAMEISIYNLRGQMLKKLHSRKGEVLFWDGFDNNGKSLPSGVYLLKASAGKAVSIRKVLKTK